MPSLAISLNADLFSLFPHSICISYYIQMPHGHLFGHSVNDPYNPYAFSRRSVGTSQYYKDERPTSNIERRIKKTNTQYSNRVSGGFAPLNPPYMLIFLVPTLHLRFILHTNAAWSFIWFFGERFLQSYAFPRWSVGTSASTNNQIFQ